MSDHPPPNKSWTLLLVCLSVILVTMVSLHIRQWQRANTADKVAPPAEPVATSMVAPPAKVPPTTVITAANRDESEIKNRAKRPVETPEDLDTPIEIQQALQKQTRTLLEESLATPADPQQKRALTISPEAVKQLEREGRMVY